MSTSASANFPPPGTPTVGSLIARLAEYIRQVPSSQSSISVLEPLLNEWAQFLEKHSKLRLSAEEATTLVDALDADGSNGCCRLNAVASQTVFLLLRMSEPCLASQRGHCLFVESLHPSRAPTEGLQGLQTARILALGQTNILIRLLKSFLDRTRDSRARRWMGLLVLEILRGSREVKNIRSKDLGQTGYVPYAKGLFASSRVESRNLGDAILHGNNEILKVIAGSIIRELIDGGSSADDFFRSDPATITSVGFPEMGERASQWTTDFIEFVDQLDSQGLLTQERAPLSFAYAVSVAGTIYSTETGLSILATVSDELTIMIPSTTEDSVKCIDIPLSNVLETSVELGGPGLQQQSKKASKAAILNLELREHAGAAYYINESKRPPCRINLAFDTVADANIIKHRIATMGASMQPEQEEEDAPLTVEQNSLQSDLFDASNDPTHRHNTVDGVGSARPQAPRSTNWKGAIFKANEFPASITKPLSHDRVATTGIINKPAKHPADPAAKTQFMTNASANNVRQELTGNAGALDEFSNSGSLSVERRRSSSVWREGLETIENAPVLQPKLGNQCHGDSAGGGPPNSNDNDDDLYAASPRVSRANSNTGNDGGDGPKPGKKRKLSQSMQVNQGERRSALPRIGKESGSNQGTNSGTKQAFSTATESRGMRKQTSKKGVAILNAKTKLESQAARKMIPEGEDSKSARVSSEKNVFDLPESPPGRPKIGVRMRKTGKSKSRAPKKNSKTDLAANARKKPLETKRGTAKAASTAKPTGRSDRKTSENSEAANLDLAGDDVKMNGRSSDYLPAHQPPQKAKMQDLSKERKMPASRILKVKEESVSERPKLGVPTRIPRGKRAAAQKAKQQIHDQFSDAYEDEVFQDEPQAIGDAEVAEEEKAEGSFNPNNNADKDILESTTKTTLATEEAVDREVPVAQPDVSDSPASTADEVDYRRPIVAEPLATTPLGAIDEEEAFHQDSAPVLRNVPPLAAIRVLDTSAPEAMNDGWDGTKNEITVEQETMIFPDDDEAVIQDAVQDQATSINNTVGLLMGDDEDIGKVNHPLKEPDRVESVSRHGKAESVPRDPHAVLGITPVKNDQAIISQVHDPGIGNSKKLRSDTIVGPDPADEPPDLRETPDRVDRTGVPEERTSPTNLALKPSNDISDLQDADGPTREPAEVGHVIQAPRIQRYSNEETVEQERKTIDEALLSPRAEAIVKNGIQVGDSEKSIAIPPTTKSQGRVRNRPGPAARISQPMAKSMTKTDIESSKKRESDTYIITSGPSSDTSSEAESVDSHSDAPPRTTSHRPRSIVAHVPGGDGNGSSVTPISVPAQRRSTQHTADKKRSRDPDDPDPSKKAKLHSMKSVEHTPRQTSAGVGSYKDPDRKPQIISFGPQGPRNQGMASSERSPRHETQADDTRGNARKRKSDVVFDINEDLDSVQAHTEERPNSKRVRIQGSGHTQVHYARNPEQHVREKLSSRNQQTQLRDRRPLAVQQPRGGATSLLHARSSILGEDLSQHISSQGSRVDENGSPLPTQRSRIHRSPVIDGKTMDNKHSDFDESLGLPLLDDDTTLVHVEMNEDLDFDESLLTSRGVRRNEVDVARSSNSKHAPSSPSAPSAIVTGVQADTIKSDGRMVNMDTDTVLVPATPHDPFTSHRTQRPNRFMEKLGRQYSTTGELEDMEVTNGNGKRLAREPDREAEDPDVTLVEADRPKSRSKRHRRAAPVSSDTNGSSSSPASFQSSQRSAADFKDEARKRWIDALKPHQKDTLDILYELSHELVGHLIDKETACNDVVNDFQRRGTRFIENVKNELEHEFNGYEAAVADRRSKDLARLQKLQAHVTKNLDRSPVAEKVARHFAEEQRVRQGKWEEVMRACEEMER
ncbi:MAG: hypothetical protein Q9169_004476 [Polycauliona sp. 2 TL-2023]